MRYILQTVKHWNGISDNDDNVLISFCIVGHPRWLGRLRLRRGFAAWNRRKELGNIFIQFPTFTRLQTKYLHKIDCWYYRSSCVYRMFLFYFYLCDLIFTAEQMFICSYRFVFTDRRFGSWEWCCIVDRQWNGCRKSEPSGSTCRKWVYQLLLSQAGMKICGLNCHFFN